ncbi:MAG: DNA polymerase III subunit delta [Clostridia bacterium]|nr:DNA polymerase III subunit delta [Clostridia bacterium]
MVAEGVFMRMEELKSSLEKAIAPVYLIEGEDAYLREGAVKILQNRCLSAPDLNFSVFEGSYARQNPEEIVEILMQYPFMSEKRVVLLRDYNPTATDLKNKTLSAYFSNPSQTSLLIIANGNACEPLKKMPNVTVVDCGKADMAVVVRYIQVTLKRENLIITTKNAQLLADYCRLEMTKVSGEVEKLISYCHGAGEVLEEDIEALVTKESDYQIYELTEKVAQKKNGEAYIILTDMLSRSNDHQKLFTSLYYHFRRLFFCSMSGKTPAVLAKELGVKEYAVKKSIEQSKKFTPKRLKEINDMFCKYDGDFKSGRISVSQALTLCMGKIMQ